MAALGHAVVIRLDHEVLGLKLILLDRQRSDPV
jgi:hypothetical protein